MMWDIVIPAWIALLEQDADLTAALGVDADGDIPIYAATAGRKIRVPSVEWVIVSDRETELFNPVMVQVDFWVRGVAAAAVIERRMRALTHRDVSRELALDEYEGLRLWTRYIDSRTHEYRADPGVVHKSIDIQFEPVRARFHTTTGG
jgi:hypothetical protein